jgi:signal transduction histidine kinase/CheY-like chemotaxis protein
VGDLPWGSHFCQFYRSGADLAETLVPYFEAGLRNNESCLWVTGSSLDAEQAETLMVEAVPAFKKQVASGQMQIVPITDWYTPGAVFDADQVLQGWVDRERESRARGFAGLRLTGDTLWVDRSGWDDFMEYEQKVNGTFRRYNLVALCTYCMDKCTAEDVVDVCRHHEFSLVRRRGEWELLESSSLKIAKEQLRQHNADLELRVAERTHDLNAALGARDEFLAMLGHELRNPLAPIVNATQLICAQAPADSPIAASAAIIARQAGHMTRLVNDLLDVARVTQGRLQLDAKHVPLAEVIEHAVELARPLIDQRRHSLEVALPGRHVLVEADRVRLAQVFGNLLHNAAKYTPPEGTIRIRASVADASVTVSVQDTGTGIPADMLGSIFDPFRQLPRSLARSEGGLGIGLTLVKRLAEMHGGSVSASSDGPGRGSEFRVRLPLAAEAPQPAEPAPARIAPLRAAERRVLVVDDNEDANATLALLLQVEGHAVAQAYDGAGALELARSFQPEAVLLDIGLPDFDGYEVVRRLKADPLTRDMHVVALTGYGQLADVQHAATAGFDGHLIKPAAPDVVMDLLRLLPRVRAVH